MSTSKNIETVEPYLNFNGRCEEAIAFYKQAAGAEVDMVMHFKDAPDQSMISPGSADKVMHASFRIGASRLMASDGRCQPGEGFQGISLSINLHDEAKADQVFAKLSAGGQVTMPLSKTFFSPKFGMLTDRFGVSWMIHVMPPS